MRTLYSVTLIRFDGGVTIVDYIDALGWHRHEFDARGRYAATAPCTAAALESLHDETATALVHELRKAAGALDQAMTSATSNRAASASGLHRLRRDHRDVLEHLVAACSQGWSEAVHQLARTPADDQRAVARAQRALLFMRDSRRHAVRTLTNAR